MDKYSGTNASVEVGTFLSQFSLIAAVNRYDDEAKKVVMAAYLEGPALYFYRMIVDQCSTYDELKNKFTNEFQKEIDYVAAFYLRKQRADEDLLSFYYALDACANKAGPAISENIFIQHYLKNCTYVNKCRLASRVYESKKVLKATISQIQEMFGDQQEVGLNLPIHIASTAATTNQAAQPIPVQATSPPGDNFHTPTGANVENRRGANVENRRVTFAPNRPNTSYNFRVRRDETGDAQTASVNVVETTAMPLIKGNNDEKYPTPAVGADTTKDAPGSPLRSFRSSQLNQTPGALPDAAVSLSKQARGLLLRLLDKDPKCRLRNLRQLQQSAFFMGTDFENIKKRKVTPRSVFEKHFPADSQEDMDMSPTTFPEF